MRNFGRAFFFGLLCFAAAAQDCAQLASRLEFASSASGASALAALSDEQLAKKVVDSLQPLQSAVGSENFSKVMAHLAEQSAAGKLEMNHDFILSLEPQFHNTLFVGTQPMLKNLDKLFAENSRAAMYPHLQAKFLEKVEGQKKVEELQVKVDKIVVHDKHEAFKVFEDSSGLVYYEFDKAERNHENAIKFCEDKGMRLPTEEDLAALAKEFEVPVLARIKVVATYESAKLKKWLGARRNFLKIWSSSVSSSDTDYAQSFKAYAYGYVSVYTNKRDDAFQVRCVGR